MDATPLLLTPGTLAFAWGGTVRLLAEGLGLELDEVRQHFERRAAVKPVRIGTRTVEPGTMGALRFEVQGIVGIKPVLVVEHVTRIDTIWRPSGRRATAAIASWSRGHPACAATSSSGTSTATTPSAASC